MARSKSQRLKADFYLLTTAALWGSGFVAQRAAFSLQAIAQVHAPPSDAAIIMSTESVFAALCGYLLLGESLNQRELFGCGLVLFGIVVSQLRWRSQIK